MQAAVHAVAVAAAVVDCVAGADAGSRMVVFQKSKTKIKLWSRFN